MSKLNYRQEYDRLKGALVDINNQLSLFKDYKNRFHILLDNMEDLVWFLNGNLEFEYVSPSVNKMLGYTEKEFLIFKPHHITHKDSLAVLQQLYDEQQSNDTKKPKNRWETGFRHKNGSWVWFETITTHLIGDNKKLSGIIGVSRNITQQKVQNDKVLDSEANLKAQFENTSDAIWSIDRNYQIKTVNQSFYNQYIKAFGIELKVGMNILDTLPEPYYSKWKKLYNRSLRGEQYTITDNYQFEDVAQFVEISFNPIKINKDIVGVAIFSRNITQTKLFEQQLIEKEANQQALLESTAARIWSIDKRLNLVLANKNYLKDYKVAFNHDLKPNCYALEKADKAIEKEWIKRYKRALNGEKFALVDKFDFEGIHQYAKTSFVPILINKKVIGVSCYSQDITQQKQTEKHLVENEERFRFLSDASFDLLKLESEEDILEYIADSLVNKLKNLVVVALKYNKQENITNIRHISGLKEKQFQKLNTLFESRISELSFNPPDYGIKKLLTGKLIKVDGGLRELLNGVPDNIADKVQEIINPVQAYTIGIKKDRELFAALHLITIQKCNIDDISFIESYINLVSLVFQQKSLVKSLFDSEEKFRKIIESSNSAIGIQNKERILLVNKAWEKITGYSRDEAMELSPFDLVHPHRRARVKEMALNRLNGIKEPDNYEFHMVTKQGQEKFIDISASVIDFEGEKVTLIIGTDITEKTIAERQLKKFSAGVMNSPLSIVITDIEGNIEYVNPFFCDFTGYSYKESLGNNPRILKSGKMNPEVYQQMWTTILNGKVWNGELQNKKKNGELYWESVRIAPIFDEENIITHFVGIKEDITEQKTTMELIEQSEKDLREINAQKDRFFNIIAHDLRSPFSAVVQLAAMLKENYTDLPADRVQLFLSQLSDTSGRVFQLIENLLEWARSQSGKLEFEPESIDLSKLIDESFAFLEGSASQKECVLENLVKRNFTVRADRNMLLTIVRNLVTNAIKYSPEGERVTVRSSVIHRNLKRYTKISIKDSGVGIPEDKIDKIFRIDENYSTLGTNKEKGTGLGLILCQEFVKQHGGEIWVESEVDKGSEFSFILPE